MYKRESIGPTEYSGEEMRTIEKCHVSDIIEGVVSNDVEEHLVGQIPIDGEE